MDIKWIVSCRQRYSYRLMDALMVMFVLQNNDLVYLFYQTFGGMYVS